MPYIDQNGEKRFSLKEKIAYHNQCANTGKKPDGTKLSTTEKVNHALASARSRRKLNRFMQTVQTVERAGTKRRKK